MTCASCVRRIEKALGRVDGVPQANVNLATEKAHVVFNPVLTSMDQMRAAVGEGGLHHRSSAGAHSSRGSN
jgi:P-type Cu+ transporter